MDLNGLDVLMTDERRSTINGILAVNEELVNDEPVLICKNPTSDSIRRLICHADKLCSKVNGLSAPSNVIHLDSTGGTSSEHLGGSDLDHQPQEMSHVTLNVASCAPGIETYEYFVETRIVDDIEYNVFQHLPHLIFGFVS